MSDQSATIALNQLSTKSITAEGITNTPAFSLTAAGNFKPESISVTNNASVAALSGKTSYTITNDTTVLNPIVRFINSVKFDDLAEWKYLFIQGKLSCIDKKTAIIKRLQLLDDRYYNGHFRDSVRKSLDRLSKPDNIKDLLKENQNFSKVIANLKAINSENKSLLKSFDNDISDDIEKVLLSDPLKSNQICLAFSTYSQIVFKRFVRACLNNQRKRDEMLQIADQLTNEITTTIKMTDETFGDDDGGTHLQNAIIIGRYNINETQMHDIGIVIRRRHLNLDADPPVLMNTDDKIVGRLRIRSSQTFIPEFSIGAVYTNLIYPTYGIKVLTATEAEQYNKDPQTPAGTTYSASESVVDAVGTQRVPVVLAGMLNLTLNAFNGLVHPLIQLGVGTGRNLPTFLMGGGLRLKWQKPIIISTGAIWAWKKQFTNLSPRQKVDGPTDLEKDLRLEFDTKPHFYLGLQITM